MDKTILNMEPLQEFFSKVAEPMDMAKELDEIENQLAIYMISDENGAGKGDGSRIYFLRQLRNALLKMCDCPMVR